MAEEAKATIQMWPHYKNFENLKTIEDIKKHFPDGKCNEMNLFMASTSGVHGSYTTLDDIQKCYDKGCNCEEYDGFEGHDFTLTVMIFHPRLVCIKYGNIEVAEKDIPYLRGLVASSVDAFDESQTGNFSK